MGWSRPNGRTPLSPLLSPSQKPLAQSPLGPSPQPSERKEKKEKRKEREANAPAGSRAHELLHGELAQTTTLQWHSRQRAEAQSTRTSPPLSEAQLAMTLMIFVRHGRQDIHVTLTSTSGLLRHDQAALPREGTSTYAMVPLELDAVQ